MRSRTKSKLSTTKGFLDGYKTYDTSKGYGSRFDWKAAFNQRFTHEEAQEILNEETDDTPYSILGVRANATEDQIKAAFRKLMLKWHPDVCKDPQAHRMTQKIIAAYSLLT